jgi:murein L,D-transpeptidase YafK
MLRLCLTIGRESSVIPGMRIFIIILLLLHYALFAGQFLDEQRKFVRVRNAEKEKRAYIDTLFSSHKLTVTGALIYLRVFKREKIVELWARPRTTPTSPYLLIRTYAICSSSGDLGPKGQLGDGQVPEGVYTIDRFNPVSSFHLSLGINYPNRSDRIRGKGNDLGGDIFIHGDCVTIGCVPIQDEYIKELYLICVYARDNGQTAIPVHFFPTPMNGEGMAYLSQHCPSQSVKEFWNALERVYAAFEKKRLLPLVTVDKNGYYIIR